MVTITLTRDELVRASGEMTPAERQSIYLMSQSPLHSTQICSLLEIVSALEKATAGDAMEKLESTEDLEDPEGADE